MSTGSVSANERVCGHCNGSMQGKRSHAVYCSRTCKTRASDRRRTDDGRAKQRDRARYAQEAEHRREYARRYLRDRPGMAKSLQLLRKARLRSVPVYRFSERDWRRLKARYDHRCAYCGCGDVELQREHVIPLARGGSHGVGNIVPACASCNYGKRLSFAFEWRLRLREREEVNAHHNSPEVAGPHRTGRTP